MYCDLWLQYIKVRKLFKGGNYSRAETIRGNTVCTEWSLSEFLGGNFFVVVGLSSPGLDISPLVAISGTSSKANKAYSLEMGYWADTNLPYI